MTTQSFDLAVIGSGQGGVPLALDYAADGKRVVLFERGKLGGSCVNVGCTPSKAFLASAHAASRARRAVALGVHAEVRVDFPAVMERVRTTAGEWNGSLEERVAKSSVTLVRAEAAFDGPHDISADGITYTAQTIVIDTGTQPARPPIPGLADVSYRTNLDIFDLTSLPARTIVLGAGSIGLELGQGLAHCGSSVHLIDAAPRVLVHEDADVSATIERVLERDGMQLHLGASVSHVEQNGAEICVVLASGERLCADLLLVAVGRTPSVPRGAREIGITLDARGYIAVDAHLATSVPHIYALGDVAGQPQFTHVSWEDYRRLKATLGGDPSRTRDDRALGYAVFTDPQVGRVGLTLAQAKDAGRNAREVTLPLEQVARAVEFGETDGFYRMVVDATSDEILGATLVGYEAGELVHVILALMEAKATWRTLERSVHIHPTYAEGLPSLARLLT